MSKPLMTALSCAILAATALPVLAAAPAHAPARLRPAKPHATIRPIAATATPAATAGVDKPSASTTGAANHTTPVDPTKPVAAKPAPVKAN